MKPDHVANADGVAVSRRLGQLVETIAKDIKDCANACDTYSKKQIIVRVLKGPIWDETLQGFVKMFADHKTELQLAISVHTSRAVGAAHDKLDALMTK